MYIRMVKKQILQLITFIIILFASTGLHSQESVISIGEKDLWNNVQITNLTYVEGKRGFIDLTNSDNEYKPDKSTDMILNLNESEMYDKTVHHGFPHIARVQFAVWGDQARHGLK